jgi:hypothetical protein
MPNESLGPVQVFSADVASINLALAEMQERMDHLKGLRGRTEIWDRARADNPRERQDVVTFGLFDTSESVVSVSFLAMHGTGIVITRPGVAYVEVSLTMRQPINFSAQQALEARVSIEGWGTEAGTGKAVAITRDDTSVIAEVVWDGKVEAPYAGVYTAVTLNTEQIVRVYVRASSATESIILSRITFDMRYRTLRMA